MKKFEIVAFLVCCSFLSCTKEDTIQRQPYTIPPPVSGINYSADEVTAFKQLTINATNNNVIVKLPAHISIYLSDTTYPYLTKELDSILSELNTLLGSNVVLSRVTQKSTSSLQVYLTDRDTYLKVEPPAIAALQNTNATGYAFINWDDKGVIYHGSVFVDMARTDKDTVQQRYIIHHEMMHVLGLLGHVDLPQFHSILFAYPLTPYILDYTPFDKKMINLLYNLAIKPGMNESDFNTAVRSL